MSLSRETIHVSLGSGANAVTAHLLNLEGLACTSSSDGQEAAYCNPDITHASYNETYVPRVLFVDESRHFAPSYRTRTTPAAVTTWSGRIDKVQREEEINQDDENRDKMQDLQQAASTLAYSTHSRYHVQSKESLYTMSSDGRHVQWDSDEDEEDEDEKQRRLQRLKHQWVVDTEHPLEDQMDSFWDTAADYTNVSWMDYWMPPRPPLQDYAVELSSNRLVEPHWDAYAKASQHSQDLLDKLRRLLEACDAIQGITIVGQGRGIYAGLATSVLQDVQSECRTAGRLVMHIVDDDGTNNADTEKENGKAQPPPDAAERVRWYVARGLALHDFTTYAHAVLPLSLDKNLTMFESSARMALALEAATLPYRLASTDRSKIGLVGGYYGGVGPSNEGYGVASQLSFGEYLACLQPSPRYPMLELDVLAHQNLDWDKALLEGSSLERQRRMQQGGRDAKVRRLQDVLAGAWLSDCDVLETLSPQVSGTNRSLHRHFALDTMLRPTNPRYSTSQYLTLLMESMAFRYRPEVSAGTVLSQSMASLTAGGYGAGSYWKFLFQDNPVLSVAGNTTRSYGYLHEVAFNFKDVLMKPRFRGYHTRDVAHGILPDSDDCTEAMELCFDVRDLYAPPEGSGLVIDAEGTYFDSNLE